jgi:fructose-bisphosphate aldolase class II
VPLATTDGYTAMLDRAAEGGFAYAAVNVTSSQTLNGAIEGFAAARSDGIVQVTVGAARYFSGPANDAATGARALAELAHVLAERAPVRIALHTDHCPPDDVDTFLRPLLAASRERVGQGRAPLFHSHMFDGSTLPLDENLERAAELLDEAAAIEVRLELEIGVVGGEEDGIDRSGVAQERLYSTVADALAVAGRLANGETEAYLLAATFGNVHGRYAPGAVVLRPELLGELQAAVAPHRFRLVFHGSSGSTDEELAAAVRHGVVKVNVDTDVQYAFTRAVADHVLRHYDGVLMVDGGLGDKRAYDPRAWGRAAEQAMAVRVAHACEQLGSAGSADR